MLLGAIADDFTGAGDLALTLSNGGMRTTQFVNVPTTPAPQDCEAGVVALKTRSAPPDEAVKLSLAAARWLLGQGCRQFFFKYCSTFDSTSQGNIGPVAEALIALLGADRAVVCPAFPRVGRRVFMGHLFVGDRLLSESGLENHPLTPMTDPDIRRWLRRQATGEVGHVDLRTVNEGAPAVREAIDALAKSGTALIVTDAVDDQDLLALGSAIAGHRLVTGGSGIALGLPANFRAEGLLSGARDDSVIPDGAAVVLCGSCSAASQAQVKAYLRKAPGLAVDPADLLSGRMAAESAFSWVSARKDQSPIVYSTADVASVARSQASLGRQEAAALVEAFFGDLARLLADDGWRRIVVGGGETSGAVVESLDIASMQIVGELAPGVPALTADRDGPIGLALKSGNFGGEDFFARAISSMVHR